MSELQGSELVAIPVQTPGHRADLLVIVLGPSNLARMRNADPTQVECAKTGKLLVNPTVIVAYEEPSEEWKAALASGDLATIGKFLERGFAFKPHLGDHDGPYQKAT